MNITKKTIIIIVTTLGAFWAPFITSSINIALPYIGNELNISSSLLNWITSSTILTIAVFILPMGKISDMVGKRNIMFLGTIILTIASFICAISQTIVLLLFGRIFQGIGNAMIATSVVSMISSAFSPGERGKVLGINVACTYIGLSLGPIIGGFIISFTSWRGIFIFSLPIGILLIILLSRIKEEIEFSNLKKFDMSGALLYGLSIFLLIFGLSNLLIYSYSKFMLILGLILLLVFIYFEKNTKNPILDITHFKKNRVLIFSSLASLINYSSTFAISYLMSLYLQLIMNLDPSTAGMILLIQPAFQAILSPLAGRLSDKVQPQILASCGMGLITIGLILFSLLNNSTSIIMIILIFALVGIGYAFFSSPNTNAIMTSVDKEFYGIASGILGTARTVGQSFSMSLSALITSFFLGNQIITTSTLPLLLNSIKTTFIVLSFLCLLGIFASLARGKNVNDEK
ncbi:MAG: MFS transporter [Eubacteriaceae bacterium]